MENVKQQTIEWKIFSSYLPVIVMFVFSSFYSSGLKANESQPPEINYLSNADNPSVVYAGAPDRVEAIDPLGHFSNFDTEQGLALSNTTCVFVDENGNIWFGTHGGGVSKYDGKEFETFSTRHGLVHNSVWAITQDSKGNIWFGTFGGGVSIYDGVAFRNFTTDDGLAHNTIWDIVEDKNGNMWLGTFGGGVSFYDGESFKSYTVEDGLPDNIVWDVYIDGKGDVWIGTEGGVSRYDGSDFHNLDVNDGLAHNTVRRIIEDRMGNFWFATFGGGASYFDGQTFTTFNTDSGLSNNVIRDMIEDSYGNIWFGTHGGGASMYNGRFFINYSAKQGLAHDVVRGLAEDKKGNIWFGTDGGGASRFNGKAVTIYTTEQGLAYNAVRCISEDQLGRLWFGTNGGGMSIYDGEAFYNYTEKNGLPSNIIYSIYPLEDGDAWIGTPEGLSYFDGNKFVTYTTDQGLPNNRVLEVYNDSQNFMWLGTAEGLSKFDGNSFTNYKTEQGLPHNVVRSIVEDSDGNIWVGTYGGGAAVFDGKVFKVFTDDNGLAHNWIRKILIDSSGYIWFGTYGEGINRYDGNSFVKYSTDDGLADDVIYDIVEDADGVIWIGTNLGYSGLVFEDNEGVRYTSGMLAVDNQLLQDKFRPVWDIYNNQTGYPIKDINSNAMCISSVGLPKGNNMDKGLIWGGCGNDKVVCFNPKAIYRYTESPPVVIKQVLINDEVICWYSLKELTNKSREIFDPAVIQQQQVKTHGRNFVADEDSVLNRFSDIRFDSIGKFYPVPDGLVLPYSNNSITFHYNAIETGKHFLIQYQYMLEGMDETWRSKTRNSFVTFNNLREGRYAFKVKAQSSEGVWSSPVSFSFRVLPPWYRTWWMYVLYGIAVFAVVWFYITWRLRSLKRDKLHLAKKVEERTAQLMFQKERAEKQKMLIEEKSIEITEQKEEILRQKEELQEQSNELEKINAHLEDRIAEELSQSRKKDFLLIQQSRQAAMGEMIANIAHQWRQPLNAVGLIIQNFQEAFDYNDLNKEYVDNKVKQGMDIIQYMSETINDFRDFFKPEKNATDFDVKHVVSRSVSFIEDTLKKCNIEMVYKLEDNITAYGYPNEYSQVVLNLINNAKDALLEENPVNPKIEIALTKVNDKSCLTITDNGGGIEEANKEKVFDPYFSTKEEGLGTGLGLYMSKTIIEKQKGGSLSFENTGEGVKFIVVL